MKQVFLLLFTFGIAAAAAAWSQINPDVAEENLCSLKSQKRMAKLLR